MSRISEFLILITQGRDTTWSQMSPSDKKRLSFLFNGTGILSIPTDAFASYFPQNKLHALLEIKLENALAVAYHNSKLNFKRTVFEMVYSHSVTLLESFISDSLIALATSHTKLLHGVATYYDEANRNSKLSLTEICNLPNGIKGRIIHTLQNDTFHNPDTILNIFYKTLGDFGKGIDTSRLRPIISRRHDIIHRNGSSTTGENLILELDMLEADIKAIREFAVDLRNRMDSAIINLTQ